MSQLLVASTVNFGSFKWTGSYTAIEDQHSDGRPMLGRKLAGKSQRELHDLGLVVADGRVIEAQPTHAMREDSVVP
jgi:hypothetical protein